MTDTATPDDSNPVYRRARVDDRDAVFRVLAFANFHHVPSLEMPVFDLADVFVAEVDGLIVGVAGYTLLEDGRGKTTLMAVDPAYRRFGIGTRLQVLRMRAMRDAGCRSVTTNADLPETIAWYKRNFGYREVGTLAKVHEFGDPARDHWTTLECDLAAWIDPGGAS
jgi:ribosomal-protein-alanine N-acetyltransferase